MLLEEAQELSLSRYELSDLISSLQEQVKEPAGDLGAKEGDTLLSRIEDLVKEEKEGCLAVDYLILMEKVLSLR